MLIQTLICPQQLVFESMKKHFDSGTNHAICAQSVAGSNIFNDCHKIGLLHGAVACFVTWFCAVHWLLRLRRTLKETIYGIAFESVSKNA